MMPEFILPEEADHCPYCGQVLTIPPHCCEKAAEEDRNLWNERPLEDPDPDETDMPY